MTAPDSGNRSSSYLAALALGLALVGAASMVYYHLALFMPRVLEVGAARKLTGGYAFGNDFYPVWLTSREWLRARRDPYSEEITREIQQGLFGRPLDLRIPTDPLPEYRTFAYPAFTDLFFWPAAKLSFPRVRVMAVVGLAALTLLSIVLWARALAWRPGAHWLIVASLLTLCSYPVLEGLYADQLGLLVGFLLAASLLALRRDRLLLAGILMALTTIKPQMTVLAVFYLLVWSLHDWRRRARFVIGLLSTVLLLVGTSLAVWPHWISSWVRVAIGYHRYAKPPLVSDVLAAPLGPAAAGPATFLMMAGLLAVAVALAWRNRAAVAGSMEFWLTLSLLLCLTTITLLPGQALHDQVILLPGIFLLALLRHELSSNWILKSLLAVGVAVLLWPWLAAFGLIVLRPLLSDRLFYSKAIFALPLRTAAVFPFVVLGLLAVAIRRAPGTRATGTSSIPV